MDVDTSFSSSFVLGKEDGEHSSFPPKCIWGLTFPPRRVLQLRRCWGWVRKRREEKLRVWYANFGKQPKQNITNILPQSIFIGAIAVTDLMKTTLGPKGMVSSITS